MVGSDPERIIEEGVDEYFRKAAADKICYRFAAVPNQ